MIAFKVEEDRLYNTTNSIQLSAFEEITGRRINWNVRVGKDIMVERSTNHVALHDTDFIAGQKYRHRDQPYICTHVSDNGTALLTPTGFSLKVKTSNHPEEWDIINR